MCVCVYIMYAHVRVCVCVCACKSVCIRVLCREGGGKEVACAHVCKFSFYRLSKSETGASSNQ